MAGCDPLKCACSEDRYVPQRYIVCFYLFTGIVVAYSLRVSFNITLPTMVAKKEKNSTECPDTEEKNTTSEEKTYRWSEKIQSNILGAFYVGYFLGHIPAGVLADIFGAKHTLAEGVLLSGAIHGLTPIAIDYGGMFMLYALRFFIGLLQGAIIPSTSVLLAHWIPAKERSTVGGFVYTGAQIGSITGNTFTGLIIAETGRWQNQFFFWAVVALVYWIFAMVFISSTPDKHRFLTDKERAYLQESLGPKRKLKVPWKEVLTSKPVWALMFGQVGHLWVFFGVVTYLPKYLREVLKFNVKKTGFLMAAPFLALWFASWLSGMLADYLINSGKCSVLLIRNVFTFISSVVPAVFIVIASYMGCNQVAATTLFILSMFSMGPFYPGMKVNNLDISKNFSGLVMALENGMGVLSFLPAGPIVGLMTPDNTIKQWRYVYWMMFTIATIFTLLYNFMASADRQQWDIDAELQDASPAPPPQQRPAPPPQQPPAPPPPQQLPAPPPQQ